MIVWPICTLTPSVGGRPNYMPRNVGGGQSSLSGFMQVVGADAGIWAVTYQGVPLKNKAQILTWDAIALLLEGRLNPLLVPVWEGSRQPFPEGSTGYDSIPHSDDSFFSDGSGYSQPVILATVAADAALRATTISIAVASGDALQPGHYFSIGERLYQIRTVVSEESGVYTVTIRPPLRAAISEDDAVEFDRPHCKMRLTSDDAMQRILDLNRHGRPSVSFIEDPF
jgi:hypothetical protein